EFLFGSSSRVDILWRPPLGTLAATYLGHPRTKADKLTSSSTWRPNMVSTDGCSFPPTTTRSPLFPAIIRRWRVTTGSPCLLGKNCAGPATSGSCIILPTTSGFSNPGLLLQTPGRNSQHSTTLSLSSLSRHSRWNLPVLPSPTLGGPIM